MLRETEFSRQDSGNAAVYTNHAESSSQAAQLSLVRSYGSAEEAVRAELLVDIYLAGVRKGCASFPTADSLTRAFYMARTQQPSVHTERWRDMLEFVVKVHVPAGERGVSAMGSAMDIVAEMMAQPLLRDAAHSERILELAREEVIRSLEDRIQHHPSYAYSLFDLRYFPQDSPLSVPGLLDLARNATFEDIIRAYEGVFAASSPVLLLSGDSPEGIASPVLGFAAQSAGQGTLPPLEVLEMGPVGKPVAEEGPSEHTQFLRAYTLAAVPGERERSALRLVNRVFGGGWTGRLMQVVREKHHLVYGIYSGYQEYRNMIRLGTEHDPRLLGRITALTQEIAEEVFSGKFQDEEFRKVQEQAIEEMLTARGPLRSCDQPSFRIDEAHRLHVKRAGVGLAEQYETLTSFDPAEARHIALHYLSPGRSQIFTYGRA